jgi:hypothetical protein
MARPPKDPAMRMDVDLRIPVTHEQKMLISKAAGAEQSDMASWARGVLVKVAKERMKSKADKKS